MFVLFISFIGQKSANPDNLGLFLVLFILMNVVAVLWLALSICNSRYRSKEVVLIFTPYLSTSIVSLVIFLLIVVLNVN